MLELRLIAPITIFYAAPRSGKTYLAVESIRQSLKDGRQVVTNIPVNIPNVYRFDTAILDGAPVYDSDIYLDEAYQYFNSRNFKSFSSSMHEFFSLCGHYGNRLVLIAQHPARLDKVIRENTSYYVKAVAFRFFTGTPIFFRYHIYDVDPSMISSSSEARKLKPVRSHTVLFRRSIARLYDTHNLRPSDPPLPLRLWVEDE